MYACTAEAYGSTRQRVEPSVLQNHEDHIAGQGFNSMTHCDLVHKFILVPQAIEIPDGKLEKIPAWNLDKVKSKKELILEAQKDQKESPLCTLMDICQLKNRSWNQHFRSTKAESRSGGYCERRLWSPGSLYRTRLFRVPDDCRKSNGCHFKTNRLWWTSSWRRISLHSGKNGGCSQITPEFQSQDVQIYGYVFHDTNGQNHGQTLNILWHFLNEIVRSSITWIAMGKATL